MATISNKAKIVAKNYVKGLKGKLKVKKALLFGSVAKGRVTRNSDIDILIISEDFKKMNLAKRLVFLSRLRGNKFLDWPMDILGYTADEFDKLSRVSSMFAEAKEQGIIIE